MKKTEARRPSKIAFELFLMGEESRSLSQDSVDQRLAEGIERVTFQKGIVSVSAKTPATRQLMTCHDL